MKMRLEPNSKDRRRPAAARKTEPTALVARGRDRGSETAGAGLLDLMARRIGDPPEAWFAGAPCLRHWHD